VRDAGPRATEPQDSHLFSSCRFETFDSSDLSEMAEYKVVLCGKILSAEMYRQAVSGVV